MLQALVSKIIFAAALLLLMQVPILTTQTIQYMQGYIDANQAQIDALTQVARENGYASVESMLASLAMNDDPVVVQDTQNKRQMFEQTQYLKSELLQLQEAGYLQKFQFLVAPSHWQHVQNVVPNYRPGIPFQPIDLAYSLGLAVVFSVFLSGCRRVVSKKRKRSSFATVS